MSFQVLAFAIANCARLDLEIAHLDAKKTFLHNDMDKGDHFILHPEERCDKENLVPNQERNFKASSKTMVQNV